MLNVSGRSRAVGTLVALVFLMMHAHVALAFDVPPNDGYVTDGIGMLTAEQHALLKTELESYAQQTGNEIAVVIIASTHGEAIEDVSLQVARKWGVGSQKNNGILLLIARDDRQARIEVGYGLEGSVPDLVAKGIIDTDIVPAFRAGKYFDGLQAAVEALKKHIGGEYKPDRYSGAGASGGSSAVYVLVGIILVAQWMLAILGRTKSWWLGGVLGGAAGVVCTVLYGWWLSIPLLLILGLLLDYIVSRTYSARGRTPWWAGGRWGPGGRGGGGFGGFGGGSFGGGGASGGW